MTSDQPDLSQIPVCRGVRGATTAAANTREAILSATGDLLKQIVAANDMKPEDIASVFLTMTRDLNAEWPALAARQMGWTDVPLLGAQEIDKPGALPQTIRVLIHWNTTRPQNEIRHLYVNGAEVLRPDQVIKNSSSASNGKQFNNKSAATEVSAFTAISTGA
jgi:chorismate mutase